MNCHQRHKLHGLSLVELVSVVTILGILAMLIVPRVVGRSSEAEIQSCYVKKADVELQVELFHRNTGSWPATDLSDMLPTSSPPQYDYFPDGAPVCPVDGNGYTIDAGTHEVNNHDHG